MRDIDLIRIEHKLDQIIRAMQATGAMFVGLPELENIQVDSCPLCEVPVSLSIDFASESIVRNCGCTLPVSVVPGISKLQIPPEEGIHGHHSRTQRDEVPPESETSGDGGG